MEKLTTVSQVADAAQLMMSDLASMVAAEVKLILVCVAPGGVAILGPAGQASEDLRRKILVKALTALDTPANLDVFECARCGASGPASDAFRAAHANCKPPSGRHSDN